MRKILGAVLALLLFLALAAGLIGLVGKALIFGADKLGAWGSVTISDGEASEGAESFETFSPVQPNSTVPPGDDPSWSQPMDSYPVDKTADEMAEMTE